MTQEKLTWKEKWNAFQKRKSFLLLTVVFAVLMAAAQCLAMEASVGKAADLGLSGILYHILNRPLRYTIAEWFLVLFIDSILLVLLARVDTALSLSALLSSALAVTNYFVYALHGTPFTFSMIKNAGTALDVLFSYTFTVDLNFWLIITVGVGGILMPLLLFSKMRLSRKVMLLPAGCLCMIMACCYVIPDSLIPDTAVSWSWEAAAAEYGYPNCLAKVTFLSGHITQKPSGYDEVELQQFTQQYEMTTENRGSPDVILILNETFYDLQQVTDVKADSDYLETIHKTSNIKTGYAVVPHVGGGTNLSEYEYLTSNSLQLAPNVTPFNSLKLEGASSLVTMLESQGYETQAIHSEPGKNYNRIIGYPALGFDTYHFQPDFQGLHGYEGRKYALDSTLYENLFRWYEQMGPGPRFFYTLTIQNHGGYDRLNPADYLIHSRSDYGKDTAAVNEFLTTISLSDQAFQNLVDYFDDSDRDVILCMVGDHAPSFIRNVTDPALSPEEKELRMRSVPYVIWSNHLELSGEIPERISMNYLVPTVLDLAGIQLSPYYDYLLSLRDEIPVLSSYGCYMTADGEIYHYDDDSRYSEQVSTYLGLAYANMNRKDFMVPFTVAADR